MAVNFSISLCLYLAMSVELVLVECLMHEWMVEEVEVSLIYHQQWKENCWYVRIMWAHPILNNAMGPYGQFVVNIRVVWAHDWKSWEDGLRRILCIQLITSLKRVNIRIAGLQGEFWQVPIHRIWAAWLTMAWIITGSTHSNLEATKYPPYSKPQTRTTCGFTALKIRMEEVAISRHCAAWCLL